MMVQKFGREDVNRIVGLKGANGELLDVFDLYGVLFVGNCVEGEWDLTSDGRFTRVGLHGVGIDVSDFGWCETEEDVIEQFNKSLKHAVVEALWPSLL